MAIQTLIRGDPWSILVQIKKKRKEKTRILSFLNKILNLNDGVINFNDKLIHVENVNLPRFGRRTLTLCFRP